MEEEKKVEEVKVEEKVEAKKDSFFAGKFSHCKARLCKIEKRIWMAVVIIILVIAAAGTYFYKIKKSDIGVEGVQVKVEQFIKDNTANGGDGITIKKVIKNKTLGLYEITIDANKQEIVAYITTDGSKFFPQAIDMTAKAADVPNKTAQAPEKTEAENKTDVPTVDLFVMSYCPYGLQMERGVLPAVEALGNKIKFNLKFVDYTLHGPKELTENVNQYCIEKTQQAKLDAYLKCFWKDSKGASAACMKTIGVNAATVATCVAATNKEFSPTEKAVGLDAAENKQFGVQGSPTLVINGTTVASGRDSASVLKAICSGFTTAPKECEKALSATAPGAGFDDEIAKTAGSTTAAPAASCATN